MRADVPHVEQHQEPRSELGDRDAEHGRDRVAFMGTARLIETENVTERHELRRHPAQSEKKMTR
jgi:hypothetical protein